MLQLYDDVKKAKEALAAKQNDEKKTLKRKIQKLSDVVQDAKRKLKVVEESELVTENMVYKKMLIGKDCVQPLASALSDGAHLMVNYHKNTLGLCEEIADFQPVDTFYENVKKATNRVEGNIVQIESAATNLRSILTYNTEENQEVLEEDSMDFFAAEDIMDGCILSVLMESSAVQNTDGCIVDEPMDSFLNEDIDGHIVAAEPMECFVTDEGIAGCITPEPMECFNTEDINGDIVATSSPIKKK